MVLVTANWRRRGLATRLVDACLDAATKQGLTTWLDATPAGAAVYGPLGFTPTLQLRRLRLETRCRRKPDAPAPIAGAARANSSRAIVSAMGFDRSALLAELGGRPGSRLVSNGDAVALVRDGRKARHIGPLFADRAGRGAGDGRRRSFESETGPLLIDAVATRKNFSKA